MQVSEEGASFSGNSRGKGPEAEMSLKGWEGRRRPLRREQHGLRQSGETRSRTEQEIDHVGSCGTRQGLWISVQV